MNTKETSADKTKYRLAEAAKKCMAASGTRCHDRDTDRADLRCDETDFLSELPGQIRPDQLVF